MPVQSCVLTHITNAMVMMANNSPVDIVFQSIAGTQGANEAFGIKLNLLEEARDAAVSLKRGTIGTNVMYFETGQGRALSANASHGVDQQTLIRAHPSTMPIFCDRFWAFAVPLNLKPG